MKQLDLGKTSTTKIFFIYVIPSILSIIFSTTAQFVDSAFIGKYVGSEGLAAITMLSPFFMLLNGVSIMIAIGGVTYAGISRGKKNLERSNYFFNLTIKLIVIIAIASSVLFFILRMGFDRIFDVDTETLSLMKDYSFWIALSFVFGMSNLTFNLFLNLDRQPVIAVVISSVSTILNVILNYLFICIYNLGISGAALASLISQFIPLLIFIAAIHQKSTWSFKNAKIVSQDVRRILINGSSELVNISSVAISGFILNKVILDNIGLSGVSAFAIALQLGGLVISFGFGVSDAVQSPISFNYGARLYHRVKELLKKGIIINLIFGLGMFALSYVFGDKFASLLVDDAHIIQEAHSILKLYGLAFVCMGSNVIISTYYTSVDSPFISGILSVLKSLVYLLIWLLILPHFFGATGMWLALVFAEFTTAITAIFVYKYFPYGKSKDEHKQALDLEDLVKE